MFKETLSKEEQITLIQILKEKYIEIENTIYIEGDYSSKPRETLKIIKNILKKIQYE